MRYEEEYTDWLYLNYRIGNGKMLVEKLEDANIYEQFLKDKGYTDD